MKIYILSSGMPVPKSTDQETVLGVYSSPKNARKDFDRIVGIDTKKKWKKLTKYARCYDKVWYITEWVIDEPMDMD